MGRLADGTYVLPAGNPVAAGQTIQSSWANTTLDDIATALTDSLDRNGRGGMLVPFQNADGTEATPGITWSNEPNSGLYRAGTGDMRVSILASDNFRWRAGGADIWANSQWNAVVYEGGAGGMPDGSADFQSIVWNEGNTAWEPTSQLLINYTTGNVTVVGDIALGGDVVLTGVGTVDGVDVSALGVQVTDHVNNTFIHFPDATADGQQYARKDNDWAVVAETGATIPDGTVEGETLRWDNSGGDWVTTTGLSIDSSGDVTASGTLDVTGATSLSTLGVSGLSSLTTLNTTGRVGIGKTSPVGALDVDAETANVCPIFTEGQIFLQGAARFEVRATLPGVPDSNTVYFLTS